MNPVRSIKYIVIVMLSIITPLFAQWGSDVRLTYDTVGSYTSMNYAWCIGASAPYLHVFWYDTRDGNCEIYYKRSTNKGINWSLDIRLTYDSSFSGHPSVAVSDSNVHVIWMDSRNDLADIYYIHSTDNGATWGSEIRLTYDTLYSWFPTMSVSGSNIHVVWLDHRDGNWEIYYKRSTDNGITWSSDTRLTSNIYYSNYPSVASNGSNVHVVWFDNRDGNWEIYYKRSTDNGATWSTDTRLTNDTCSSECPCVAVSGQYIHLLWYDKRDNQCAEIYYKRSTDEGITWGPDTRLSYYSFGSYGPSVADSGSLVHVAWNDFRDGNHEIYYKRSTDNGITWDPDTRLTNNSFHQYSPSVAASDSGVYVVWSDTRDGNYEIYFKCNLTGNEIVEDKDPRLIIPQSYNDMAAIPNPFTDFTTFPGHGIEKILVYNLAGIQVGNYSGVKVGSNLPAGIYFCNLFGSKSIITNRFSRIVKIK